MIFALLLWSAALPVGTVELSQQTVKEFKAYMDVADRSVRERIKPDSQGLPAPQSGAPVIQSWNSDGPRGVTDGLIHDWVGAVFVPKATAADAIAVLQDVEHYRKFYPAEVLAARLLNRDDDKFHVYLRIVKKKVVSVVLDTEYDVEYRQFGRGRHQVWSRSTRISEVDSPGGRDEKVKPPDVGFGFLWRLNSYWQIEEREGGIYLECRAISLTRDVPPAFAWMIKPLITGLPRESLINTLQGTRDAVLARVKR